VPLGAAPFSVFFRSHSFKEKKMEFPKAGNLGFPRIGSNRELKFALEAFWSGKQSEADLRKAAYGLRVANWNLQHYLGIATPPSNDFSFYDHVLDTAMMFGAIPKRFRVDGGQSELATYFAMARGTADAHAMEMTKWFDTNYHYVVPEFEDDMVYSLSSSKAVDEYVEARSLGFETRPVVLGPVSFVLLGKPTDPKVKRADVLASILPLYAALFAQLKTAGAEWVQIDEPCLCLDLDDSVKNYYREAYSILRRNDPPKLLIATYFGSVGDNLDLALDLGVEGLHLDLTRAPEQFKALLNKEVKDLTLSLGLIDGRNIWRTRLTKAVECVRMAVDRFGVDRVEVAPSCSLLHSPVDLEGEERLDEELRSWMAFAKQKLQEVMVLARSIDPHRDFAEVIAANEELFRSRRASPRIHREGVQRRLEVIDSSMTERQHAYEEREVFQQAVLGLPVLPTTTIGSFPQTVEVRKKRAAFRAGKLERRDYEKFLETEIERCIRFQEDIGIDVLVHGEFERNDMVEYFGDKLDGFAFTENAWVQSYGSRCVKPPIIFGDVSRREPMTVRWTTYAQSLTEAPVKGMLTGPVTILQWSFVRDDQPRSETCRQLALAIRDEVKDLEDAGIRIIQIDEPAIREGLPLRRADWPVYLAWSVDAFRLASAGVKDETQIHTHMCYAEFNDIMDAIIKMDADVISLECSRSRMELLDAFQKSRYPNEIGPGVYDIHSPRVPLGNEMEDLLRRALAVIPPGRLWVNPDCGLKTRGWKEVQLALRSMVQTARRIRKSLLVS
jgi:5-methyltetrahydropteroyltriglutamate--homocysteine methyltransferase